VMMMMMVMVVVMTTPLYHTLIPTSLYLPSFPLMMMFVDDFCG